MLDQLIRQLDDADPARRKQAVIALGKSRDASALKPLANVYRSDPEPEIRELARKAGVYIKQHAEVIPDVPATTPPMPKPAAPVGESYTQRKMREMEEAKRAAELAQEPRFETQEADTRRPICGREYQVPKEARERAAKAVDAALSYNLAGDDAKAMKNLTEAISLNPNLINDAYFNSITAGVTGLDGDAAMDMILIAVSARNLRLRRRTSPSRRRSTSTWKSRRSRRGRDVMWKASSTR